MIETIKNDRLEIAVKSLGAELTSLKTVKDNKQFLWQGDSSYWKGQSTILFPIIGGIPDGKYELDGKTYEMNSHGFARASEFELAEKTESKLVYKLRYSEETLRQYSYKFEFHVSYQIEKNILRHGFTIKNLDERDMLFSVGAHPGFNCPLYDDERMDNYRIVFEKPEKLLRRIKNGSLLSGEKEEFMNGESVKELSHGLFYDGAVILDGVDSKWLEIRNPSNSRVIRVEFEGFPYLGIWSARNDAPFICIEPWFGIDSTTGDSHDFTRKEGLQKLKPDCSFNCEYAIVLDQE